MKKKKPVVSYWSCSVFFLTAVIYTGWRTKCHTIDCKYNTLLLLQNRVTSGTELILIGWKIVPNEEHVQCDHRFASCKRTLAFVTTLQVYGHWRDAAASSPTQNH